MKLFKILLLLTAILGVNMAEAKSPHIENYVNVETKDGSFTIGLYPKVAPQHVEAFLKLTKAGFYDGLYFHRVIPGFVAQGGDPLMAERDEVDYTLPLEISPSATHKKGALGMARLPHDKDSASTQFYISLSDNNSYLDGDYTVFGEVVSGMDIVEKIEKGDKMIKLTIKDNAK